MGTFPTEEKPTVTFAPPDDPDYEVPRRSDGLRQTGSKLGSEDVLTGWKSLVRSNGIDDDGDGGRDDGGLLVVDEMPHTVRP